MSSPAPDTPNNAFQDRLNRVAEARAPLDAAKPEVSVIPDWKENFRYPGAIVGSALFGMLAVLIARYVRFQVMGGTLVGEDADITMAIDAGIGAACGFLLFSMLRFNGKEFKAAQTFGIMAMVMIMHNFVHYMPGVFNVAFSEEWTEDVIAYTEPNSLLFRGTSFVLYEPASEVATAPVIRRGGKL